MGKTVKIRSIFDPSEDVGLDCREHDEKTGEYRYFTRTKQADKEACDINNILRRYEKTGILSDMILENPQYGDFSDVASFQEACQVVRVAEEQFGALSARVRERFGNDPANMLAFCADPANRAEMVDLGLAVAPSPATPTAPDSGPAKSGNPTPATPVGKGA